MDDDCARKMCLCPCLWPCVCLYWCCLRKEPPKEPPKVVPVPEVPKMPVVPKEEKHVMDNLFANKLFFLIYVDPNDKMSLVKPFENKGIHKDIQEKGYRCISHVWGTYVPKGDPDKDKFVWKNHGIKDVTWRVETRIEKRERLMQIFKYHKGYFWMDNLCIDQDKPEKPINIMGDIYRKCLECVCMLDYICDIPGYTSEKDVLKSISEEQKTYNRIADGTSAFNVPDDAVRRYPYLGFFHDDPSHPEYHQMKYKRYINNLISCKWRDRIWTWQEADLPSKLVICAEEAGPYKYYPIDEDFFNKLFTYNENDPPSIFGTFVPGMRGLFGRKKRDILDILGQMFKSGRVSTNAIDYVYGVTGILNISVPNIATLKEAVSVLETELRKKGIFTEHRHELDYESVGFKELQKKGIFIGMKSPEGLSSLYQGRSTYNGIRVLGRNDFATEKFDDNVTIKTDNFGKILLKKLLPPPSDAISPEVYYLYKTDIGLIALTKSYNIGDTIEITKVGTKECDFGFIGPHYTSLDRDDDKEGRIFEIVGIRVKTIGFLYRYGHKGLGEYLDGTESGIHVGADLIMAQGRDEPHKIAMAPEEDEIIALETAKGE